MLVERKKQVDIATKLPFRVWVASKGNIVMIALIIYVSPIGVAIARPSMVECPSTIPRNEGAKFCDSNLQLGKDRAQFLINIVWPFSWQWVKARESSKDGSTELYRSGASSVQFPNMEQRPNTNKGSNQRSGDSGKNMDWQPEDFQWVPHAGIIPILIFLADALIRYRAKSP